MSQYVLVIPTIHGSLESLSLTFQAGASPKKNFNQGEFLDSGKTAIEYGISDNKRGAMKQAILSSFRGREHDVDLSLRTPVPDQYFGTGDFFGIIKGDVRNRYNLATAIEDNHPPETLDQLHDSNYQHACRILTSTYTTISGRAVHNQFFDGLRANRPLISSQINAQEHILQSEEEFWQSVNSEYERLSAFLCPLIEHDGRDL